MNIYQLIVLWLMVVLLSVLSYPFYDDVLDMNSDEAKVSAAITSILLIGITLLYSLKNIRKR